MTKGRVAALRVDPSNILPAIERLCALAGMKDAMDPRATTILKDNISWHFPFPAANTTPWQLEGSILALRGSGFQDLSCVQNKTVVTDAFKGEDLNQYLPILKQYGVPVLYNFREEDMKWVVHRPKARMHVLDTIFPEGIRIPDYFFGKNIVHLPTVKCVAGDTEVVLGDGTVTTIRELVTEQIARAREAHIDTDGDVRVDGSVELMAMDSSGRIRPLSATSFWRTAIRGRRLLRIRTRTGRTLTATPDHLVHTPEGWTELGAMEPGARIALARRLSIPGSSQPLPQTHSAPEAISVVARSGRIYDATFNQQVLDDYQRGTAVTAIAAEVGVRWQTVQAILRRHRVPIRRNITQISMPLKTSPSFWRWMGYFMAEGCIERSKSSDKFWWINHTREVREDFLALTRELFGINATPHSHNQGVHIYSRRLGSFFEELGLPVPLNAGNKFVPRILFRCPEDEIAAFLSGYLDGDGHVCAKQAEINATSKSERLAHDVQTLCSRLGVPALVRQVKGMIKGRWSEPRTYFQVSVAGSALIRLREILSLRQPEKTRRLADHAERLLISKQPSNWDTVPLPREEFRSIRLALGLTHQATGKPSAVNSIENTQQLPTPRIAHTLIHAFEDRITDPVLAGRIARLRAIASEDLAWDYVESIEDVSGTEEHLYDVTVPEGGSFVGNGLVLHNCHIYTTTTGAMKNAFGGLLHTHRHYTHTWIHRTLVDLLAIQKEIHTGVFAIMDGTTAGNGPGPRTMFPVVKNWMLASADQVAIDAVAAKMMGFDPLSLEYIRVAHEDGLGVGDPRDIEVVGDDVSKESWGFRVGDNGASLVGDLLWFSPLQRFQKLFFRTPLVNVFIFGSEAYHDYYRWPMKDRRVFEKWLADTPWGQLFQRYTKGPIGPAGARQGGAPEPVGTR